ncbi:unnamed protein product, partial [Hapterophycus canaliculatus]
MAQGFILGAVSGTAIAVGLGAIASVVAPMPEQDERLEVAYRAPIWSVAPTEVANTPPTSFVPEQQSVAAPIAALEPNPAADTLSALETTVAELPLVPRVVAIQDVSATFTLDADDTFPERGSVAVASESPVPRSPQALAPLLPAAIVRAASITGSDIAVRRPDAVVVRSAPRQPAQAASQDAAILPQVVVAQPEVPTQSAQ